MKEFDFIRHYLQNKQTDNDVLLGIGDDAAIVRPREGFDLCFSSDMLLANRHFFPDVAPEDLACKILAVNLSDMAAMGAIPRWILLSVALPELNESWLRAFCDAFFRICQDNSITLIGGDTTQGEMVFNITIIGELPRGQSLRRSGAKIDDDIWVSGEIGTAAAALQHLLGKLKMPSEMVQNVLPALHCPIPRVALGQALLPIAHAAQDISDGIAQDLSHILQASNVGARIEFDKIPVYRALQSLMPSETFEQLVLTGGDDYELIFTASPQMREMIENAGLETGVCVHRIGKITASNTLEIIRANGSLIHLTQQGYDHFG